MISHSLCDQDGKLRLQDQDQGRLSICNMNELWLNGHYKTLIGSPMLDTQWTYFWWPWMTLNPWNPILVLRGVLHMLPKFFGLDLMSHEHVYTPQSFLSHRCENTRQLWLVIASENHHVYYIHHIGVTTVKSEACVGLNYVLSDSIFDYFAICTVVGEIVEKHIHALRTQHTRLCKSKPSGSAAKHPTGRQRWILEKLHFLQSHVKAKQSASNLSVHRNSICIVQ